MPKTLSIILSAVLAATCGMAYAAQPADSFHVKKGVSCTTCHGEAMKARPTRDTCLKCHGPVEKLASKTEHLNFTSTMKNAKTGQTSEHKALVNPHDSYHFGSTLSCNECHSEHKASRNDCSTCHDTAAWKIKDLH